MSKQNADTKVQAAPVEASISIEDAVNEILPVEEDKEEENTDDEVDEQEEDIDQAEEGEDDAVDDDEEGTEEETDDEDLEDSADDEEEQEEVKDLHSLLVDGQEHKVTSEEMKTLAQQGMDYTNKTKVLAEQRKAVETVQSDYVQKIDKVVGELQVLEFGLTNPRITQAELDTLATENPAEFTRVKHEEEKRQQSLKYVRDRIDAAKTEQQSLNDANVMEAKKAGYQELVKQFPEFAFNATDKKPSEAATNLNGYLLGMEFNQEDIDAIADPRQLIVAEKARRYDELQANKSKVRPKDKKVPKVTKKKAPMKKVPKKATAMKKLEDSGSIDDALDVLLTDMEK